MSEATTASRAARIIGLAVACACLLGAWPTPLRAARAGERPASAHVRALGDAYRAFQARDYAQALRLIDGIDQRRLLSRDYALYIEAQSAYLVGRHGRALGAFRALGKISGSRFRELSPWRVADCLWELGRYQDAQKQYRALVAAHADDRDSPGDVALARFRIAWADAERGRDKAAIAGFRELLLAHPAHPMSARAEARLLELGGDRAATLSPEERIARAQRLTDAHLWHEAVAELALIADDQPAEVLRERDYWTATTLFKMRRRYKDASDIFLRIYKDMGGRAARALFHGARALSRADFDTEAITWYQRVVAEYPGSSWAAEAQFLSGWLAFNLGRYQDALPHLEQTLKRYPRSKWAAEARWFLGFSLYRLGRYEDALEHFAVLARLAGKLEGGQGRYWHARTLQRLGRADEAVAGITALVERYPFSWYAQLARARLAEVGVRVGPFGEPLGETPRSSGSAPALGREVDPSLAADPLIRRADELLAAGLVVEAGVELRRGERAFIERVVKGTGKGKGKGKRKGKGERPGTRASSRADALAILMDRYREADNFNRPWMLAVVYGGRRALDQPPVGQARVWWEHAYPLAYRELVERWRHEGDNPPYYLYAIMRKESGFDPHVLSYADAIGLLQMIPPTTRRVVRALGMDYTEDLLYDPELNIRAGSWYIGRLLRKFKDQVPLGSGSFNSGPRPVMRWIDTFGDLPMDEFVETVPYRQTRGYMKKVTETYSRYLYLYEGIVYDQPLVVNRDYLRDQIDY